VENLLVFKGYGDKRFLSEVRWSDISTARGLMETKANEGWQGSCADAVNVAAISR
jgi:hypothetical protein